MSGASPGVCVAIALALFGGCGPREAEEPESADPTPIEEPTNPPAGPEESEEPAPLDLATACGRAEQCCFAFAAAVPHVRRETACAGPREATDTDEPDPACDRMRVGWHHALERLNPEDIPEACADPVASAPEE